MTNPNVLFSGFILAVGVIYWVMALRMPRGSIVYPGPGLYPSVIGVFLILTAAVCFGMALMQRKNNQPAPAREERPKPGKKKPGLSPTQQLLVLLVFYIWSLKYLGFLVGISIFVLVSMRIFGYRRWLPALLITALIVAISYMTFVYWLSVPLPRGFLGDYLG